MSKENIKALVKIIQRSTYRLNSIDIQADDSQSQLRQNDILKKIQLALENKAKLRQGGAIAQFSRFRNHSQLAPRQECN